MVRVRLRQWCSLPARCPRESTGRPRWTPRRPLRKPSETNGDLSELPTVLKAIKAVEEKLGDEGRVLVRFSGTEAKARVLIEGPNAAKNQAWAAEIGDALKRALAL